MPQKKIVIVGVGALGSHLLLFTRNVEATFKVIDFDKIEAKNVLSQFHTRMGMGRNKAQALQQAMNGLFGVKIDKVEHRLTADNVAALLGGADLVVDCLDNGASRKLIQDFVRANGVPCLHGALAPGGTFGRVVWDEQFVIDDEAGMGAATCEDGEHLPFISQVSSYLAVAVQRFMKSGKKIGFQVFPTGITVI